MSIASEIQRLQQAKALIKQAIEEKLGNEVPSSTLLEKYYLYIDTVYQVGYDAGYAAGGGQSSSSSESSSSSATPVISVVTATTNVNGTVGTAITSIDLSNCVSVTPSDTALTFSASNLPAGLSLSSVGVLSGTPSATSSATVAVTVSATGAESVTLSLVFAIAEETPSHEYVYTVSGSSVDAINGNYWQSGTDPDYDSPIFTNGNGFEFRYHGGYMCWGIYPVSGEDSDGGHNNMAYNDPSTVPTGDFPDGIGPAYGSTATVSAYSADSSSSSEQSSSSEESSSSSSSPQVDTVTLSGTDYSLDGTYSWDSAENAYVNGNYKIFWDSTTPEWAIKTVDEQMTYYELYSPSLVGDRSEILGTQDWTDFMGGMTTASLTITAGGADAAEVSRAASVYGDGVSRRITGDTTEELRHSGLINE